GDVEHYDEEKDDWSTGYYGTGSRQQVTDDVFHKLETGEEFTRDDFIKAELALQDAKLEAGIDLEKEKSPGLIGKYHDWKKNRVRHKVNKKKYLLLCLFLGWCGGHRYYEKRYVLAAFYTLFFWSVVPFFLCVTDLLIALPMQADENGDILI
ncbi:TM2 domain-containing protein, partial [Faecalibacterium sp. Marseille-Q4137]|uniref:TM2 domain-containing protein n=1 Tax=Faecalibacterium sp. Marseille-Q4137 TaxID=2817021 RepID=UPI001A9B86AE